MKQNMVKKSIKIAGMTCINCETRIETALQNTEGIVDVKVNYTKETAILTFNENIITLKEIEEVIEKLGYQIIKSSQNANDKTTPSKIVETLVIILALYMIMNHFGVFGIFNYFPQAKEGMGYGMLLIIGLLTSVHCIAMCGGINLSQCTSYRKRISKENKLSDLRPSILYNLGRVISYTIIGGIVGALGSVISLSSAGKGIIAFIAGVFMIIMGLNMLNIFPGLRSLTPHMPKFFARKINEQKKSNSPLYVGLLNGLMPCGPLQAMQIYALSTGDPVKGALSMMFFSLGTVPLMFGLGALSTILTKKFTTKMMTVSAILIVILGFGMFRNGMALSGYAMPSAINNLSISNTADSDTTSDNSSTPDSDVATAEIIDGIQYVTTGLSSGGYEPINVQAGVPVRWTIQAEQSDINGCNNALIIPEYNIEKKLVPGDNVIEFTPEESGAIPYSCWMGMIRSQISVYDSLNDQSQALPQAETTQLPNCCQ